MLTRRRFIKSAALLSACSYLPAFLEDALAAQDEAGPGRILVVLQLGGGNDGLNTVIPYREDQYFKLRPKLAQRDQSPLLLSHDLALHRSLRSFKELYDQGKIAVINGVGYPNPDRSHFRSMEIWQTASDSNVFQREGWIGKYFDNCCSGRAAPYSGVNIGAELEQVFNGASGVGVAFQNPGSFGWREGHGADNLPNFAALNEFQRTSSNLDFLRHVTADILASSEEIERASRYSRRQADYPAGKLGRDLRIIADMIAGGLQTRIYYLSHTGFDTHANQLNQHDRLLKELADGIKAFVSDLDQISRAKEVAILCFSEFGRRAEENASGGTDHGTAGPMFLIGDKVKPGIASEYPSLKRLQDGDLIHTVDFRSVYAEVLRNWLNSDPEKVLGHNFPALSLFA